MRTQLLHRNYCTYIKCSITNLKFLIDTGSSCSVIPVDSNSRDYSQDYLSAVNGSSVPTFGCKNITIDLGGPVPFNWEFCIAETLKPVGAVKSLQLILLEVILTNQFVFLFKQKTKTFVLLKSFFITNYFFILS